MYYCYILKSIGDGSYYVGYTGNLERRLIEHNSKSGHFTSNKAPWQLAYFEEYVSRIDAVRREVQIKSMKSREYIRQLVESLDGNGYM